MRTQPAWTWGAIALLVGGLALPGCQEMGNDRATATSAAAPVASAPAEADYPLLQTVPPRPRLSYTVEQQRQIVEALIADRELARYSSQVVRHRSGLSSMPPPPTAPEPAAPIAVEPDVAVGDRSAPEQRLAEQETLVDFLNALLFDEPAEGAVREPAPERAAEPEERSPAAPAARPDRPGSSVSVPAGTPTDSRSGEAGRQAPTPPARSAVAARLAAGSDVIDAIVDASVPQAPLPPGQSALAARLVAPDQIESAASPAPVPALRPGVARPTAAALPVSLPAPPPHKPIVPASAPSPPRPVEKPADDRSAAAGAVGAPETASAAASPRAPSLVVATAAP
jgi:hypothetical protein